MKIEMETVQVGCRSAKCFPQGKNVNGRLAAREVHYRRGRKFVVWMPWTIEAMQDIVSQHGLDLEEELVTILMEEIEREGNESGWFTLEEIVAQNNS